MRRSRPCGIRDVTLFDRRATEPASPVKSRPSHDVDLSRRERRRWSRSDRFGAVAAARRLRTPGSCDDVAPPRVGVFLGAGTGRFIEGTRSDILRRCSSPGSITQGRSQPRNHFSSTPATSSPSRFGLEASPVVGGCRRARQATIAIGQAADAVRAGRLDAALWAEPTRSRA